MPRNISIDAHFNQIAARHQPQYRFDGSSQSDWSNWREALLPAVKKTLGEMPSCVDLNSELILEWREDGLIKQKIIFDVEQNLSVTAYLFRPERSETAGDKLPAILCCHGHGPFGKETVMGNRGSAELCDNITLHNYDYGLQMAKAGCVTMAIDWRGFGERDDRNRPTCHDVVHGYDICNIHYLRASLLGSTVLAMDIHDGMRAIDYLASQPFVDSDAIGIMGLSFGGTMTTWLSICDDRIKASDIICYSDRFANFAMRDANVCGSQITPGLYALCDVPDLHGLIAPRPLLVEIGIHDTCFRVDAATSCYREVERIYAAAAATDKLQLDLFEAGHCWGANHSVAFFKRWLK